MFAKFQLYRLIFIFISCQQLLTAVTIKVEWNFHLPPKAETHTKFQFSKMLGGLARECDAQTDAHTDRRQVII